MSPPSSVGKVAACCAAAKALKAMAASITRGMSMERKYSAEVLKLGHALRIVGVRNPTCRKNREKWGTQFGGRAHGMAAPSSRLVVCGFCMAWLEPCPDTNLQCGLQVQGSVRLRFDVSQAKHQSFAQDDRVVEELKCSAESAAPPKVKGVGQDCPTHTALVSSGARLLCIFRGAFVWRCGGDRSAAWARACRL